MSQLVCDALNKVRRMVQPRLYLYIYIYIYIYIHTYIPVHMQVYYRCACISANMRCNKKSETCKPELARASGIGSDNSGRRRGDKSPTSHPPTRITTPPHQIQTWMSQPTGNRRPNQKEDEEEEEIIIIMHTHIYIYIYIYIHTHTHIHTYIHTYIYNVYTYTYTHTHKHTHKYIKYKT